MKNCDIDKIEASNENKYLFITSLQTLIKIDENNVVPFISLITKLSF